MGENWKPLLSALLVTVCGVVYVMAYVQIFVSVKIIHQLNIIYYSFLCLLKALH